MNGAAYAPEHPEAQHWDVLVIGTGMGGSVIGYELAKLGRRVLFVEKGLLRHGTVQQEQQSPVAQGADPADAITEERLRNGVWPTPLTGVTNFGKLDFYAPLGCGSGGSTAMYAAALERFAPADFAPRANFPDVEDSTLPERWPISYDELSPFYARAEQLFGVCGTRDELAPNDGTSLRIPPPLSRRDEHFHASFRQIGLHPYRVHAAYEFVDGCTGCIYGHCARACKKDAAWACLLPALTQYSAKLLTRCKVTKIEASKDSITGVRCNHAGKELLLKARIVVLAAGAYMTPVLLLNSRSDLWPDGLANTSGWVGRNLMFHATDLIAVTPLVREDSEGPQKSLALNDLYHAHGEKLGTFQTIGAPVTVGHIMQHMRDMGERDPVWWKRLLRNRPRWWGKLTSPAVRLVALLLYYGFNFRNAAIWASIVEDLPYFDNRILVDPQTPSGIRFEYRYRDELRRRVRLFRSRIAKALAPHRTIVLSGESNLNFGHVCGTCRFGDDPRTSVLDAENRAHGISNLFVVDASFFPSSGGTNPSLTIAANALRVAGIIHRRLESRELRAGAAREDGLVDAL